jgi:Mg/Co/Ni transporter MgtE
MSEEKKLKVEFAPGCFDHLDVDSQEELDAIMAELTDMFANMTPKEIEDMSTPVTDETLAKMDPEERANLMQALDAHDVDARKRKLQ